MRLQCPISSCLADNEWEAEYCIRCGVSLRSYAQFLRYPSLLFNQGLVAARAGQVGRARDCFAAVVYWCPNDLEARDALALACHTLGDVTEAEVQWEAVLARSPSDMLATQGLSALTPAKRKATLLQRRHRVRLRQSRGGGMTKRR